MIITSILMFSNDYQDNNNDHNIKHIYLAIQLAFNITIFMILVFLIFMIFENTGINNTLPLYILYKIFIFFDL